MQTSHAITAVQRGPCGALTYERPQGITNTSGREVRLVGLRG
jgi:hypothetical protein